LYQKPFEDLRCGEYPTYKSYIKRVLALSESETTSDMKLKSYNGRWWYILKGGTSWNHQKPAETPTFFVKPDETSRNHPQNISKTPKRAIKLNNNQISTKISPIWSQTLNVVQIQW